MSNLKPKCFIEDCERPSRARMMCDMHYRRVRRLEAPDINRAARKRWEAKNPTYSKNKYQRNKILLASKNKQYREDNADALREYLREWRRNNRSRQAIYTNQKRAKKRRNGSFKITKREMTILRISPCFYCGSPNAGTIDHIIPLNRGGRNSIGNLISACRKCNSSKSDKLIVEWKKWKSLV